MLPLFGLLITFCYFLAHYGKRADVVDQKIHQHDTLVTRVRVYSSSFVIKRLIHSEFESNKQKNKQSSPTALYRNTLI